MRLVALNLVVLFSVASIASAQTEQKPPKLSPECRQQMMAACPKSDDHKAHHACMMASKDKLSASCQGELAARHEAMREHWRKRKAAVQTPPPPAQPAPPPPAQ